MVLRQTTPCTDSGGIMPQYSTMPPGERRDAASALPWDCICHCHGICPPPSMEPTLLSGAGAKVQSETGSLWRTYCLKKCENQTHLAQPLLLALKWMCKEREFSAPHALQEQFTIWPLLSFEAEVSNKRYYYY